MDTERLDRGANRQEIAEEAVYWDVTDTSDLMAQETQWETLEWTSHDDRCDRCGAVMQPRQIDLRLADGRVILRQVTRYVCRTSGCGQTRLASGVAILADEIETLVQRTLAGGVLRAASLGPGKPQPAQVREDNAEYGNSDHVPT
jgi:hypothetical protein